MDETILTWNVTNWITVVIMAALGFTLLALVAQVFHRATGGKYAGGSKGGGSQYSATAAPGTTTA